MIHNCLIDNSSKEFSMQNYLKRCIQLEGVKQIKIATGYWDIPGMLLVLDELSAFLERDGVSLSLLIGKDPYVYTSLLEKPKYKNATYPHDFIQTDIHELEVKEEYKRVIDLLLTHCQSGKLQIRLYTKNANEEVEFLHAKCYIFMGDAHSMGIIGSSNFTQKGLLGNSELNYLETNAMCITACPTSGSHSKGHDYWFDEKWALSKPWTQTFLEQIIKKSPIYTKMQEEKATARAFTPYEQYIKVLQLQFGTVVDTHLGKQIESYLPADIRKLTYQIDAVKRCISIMREHGGFMLSDVVGLGKTIVGALIIKHFITVPEDDGRERKVLIITPPAIQTSWKKTIALFDHDTDEKISPYIDFVTTGSIAPLVEKNAWEGGDDDLLDTGAFEDTLQERAYGLIMIDESHKFRNSTTQMYQSLDKLIGDIGIETGVYPYVGLLSATPQNNRPDDLKNQIYLFQRNRYDSTLKKAERGNLERFFANINNTYKAVISRDNDLSTEERKQGLAEVSQKIRECILSDILERRTRTDIKKYYQEDMLAEQLIFPEIVGPNNLEYTMDDELAALFADTMSIIAPTEEELLQTDYLNYARYRAIEYFVDPKHEAKYKGKGNRGVQNVAKQMATIMQVLLVKRLESSFPAFKESLSNLRDYTNNMIKMWENDTIFICPQIDVNSELDHEAKSKKQGKEITFDDCIEEIRRKITKLTNSGKNEKGQNAEYQRADFKADYYEQLQRDAKLIEHLHERWYKEDEDPKTDAFKEQLKPVLFDPKKNTSGKLVIFSEAIHTAQRLERVVKARGYKPLLITAANRDAMEQVIAENFDANYTDEWKDDYNVIITTEVLAEGVNLHRANVILNYDTPWNATRLMQRIGRVNRIGSKEPCVYVYNFMPSAQGDAQIQLVRKAYTKLQSFHILFGEDNKIFSEEESLVQYDLVRAVEGEESPMQKYISELKQYKDKHPKRYAHIAQTDTGWEIAQKSTGTAYFIVKAPRSVRLALRCEEQEDTFHVIPLVELLEAIRVDENAKPTPLPEHWQTLSRTAIRAYNQYFVNIKKAASGDKATLAKEVIMKLSEGTSSPQSKQLLMDARKLLDKGSVDIMNQLIAIGKKLKEHDTLLFPLQQEDIDNRIEQHLAQLVAHVEKKQGTPVIILGTIK